MTIADRILAAVEKYEAECAASGIKTCSDCGGKHTGAACSCDGVRPATNLILIAGAFLAIAA